MNKIINFINEKKTGIFSIIVLTTSFLSLKSIIDTDTVAYINAVSAVIFGIPSVRNAANYLGKKLGYSK